MLEGRHYQNAFITRDIEKGIESFQRHANVRSIMRHEGDVNVRTPKGEGAANNKIAFIWVDNIQYELIQPVSGLVDMYADELPEDDSMKFHHICMRVPDWTDFRARAEEGPFPIVYEGGSDHLRFLYLDARPVFGHYLEYTWMGDEMWTRMGGL